MTPPSSTDGAEVKLAATFDPNLDPPLLTALEPWLRTQRWFPVKGTAVACTALGGIDLSTDEAPAPWVRLLLVTVESVGSGTRAVLQVPLVLSRTEDDAEALTTLDGLSVYDGAGHPAFVSAWLASAEGPVADDAGPALRDRIVPTASKVITGEQSNTSVVLSDADGPVGMLKVLRSLTPGDNPDVDVPRRLAEVGWDGVPAPLGWLSAAWPDPSLDDTVCLSALSRFVPDAADGFALACDYAGTNTSFETLAADLGTVVAGMHRALLTAYGPSDDRTGGGEQLAAVLRERFAWAAQQVPALAVHADVVEARADALASITGLPARQRVHGDLHLGQVLRGQDRWYVLDFEGEPLAPVEVRTRPDLALRDVAGVLRSFDYAAAVGGLTGAAAEAWVTDCRTAFWTAYRTASADPTLADCTDVLRALELDKVLYEVVYESRNRPDWVAIPQHGLDRLLASV